MIDPRHPLAVPTQRLPWSAIEAAVTPMHNQGADLPGAYSLACGNGLT